MSSSTEKTDHSHFTPDDSHAQDKTASENVQAAEQSESAVKNSHWGLGKLLLFCIPLSLVTLLVSLDEGVLATAIPRITDDFDSFQEIGWYGPSYLFGLCAFQLPFGRAYKEFATKPTYLASLFVFEIGSIIQAAAPTSGAFIAGRVLSGVGGAGVLSGTLVIFSESLPKKYIPYVMGSFGWIMAVGSIGGPVIGGAITSSYLTWRWCFWINPILCVPAVIPVIFTVKLPNPVKGKGLSFRSRLLRLDYFGIGLSIPSIVSLLLALQFGGSVYTWSDSRTIAALVVSAVLAIAFIIVEIKTGDRAILPPAVVLKRVVMLSCTYTATLDGSYFILVYYLPIWFQAVQGLSPRDSGIHIIPLLGLSVLGGFIATWCTGKLGYYQPFMALGSILLTIGSGLLTTLSPGASIAQWVLFQMIVGAGSGSGGQLPIIAVQDALDDTDVPIGIGVVLTFGYLGSSVALAVAQAIFASRFRAILDHKGLQTQANAILRSGATDLQTLIATADLDRVRMAYNSALNQSWYAALVLAGVSLFAMAGLKWQKLQANQKTEDTEKNQDSKPE